MQNIQKHFLILLAGIAVLCLFLTHPIPSRAQGGTVAILPFHLNAPPENSYLVEGLRDMLASRLRVEAGATIVDRNRVRKAVKETGTRDFSEDLPGIARRAGADYLVYGTITALGGGISIDARVYAADPARKVPEAFYASAVSSDQVMRAIDTLAWDIIEALFDKKRPAAMIPAASQPAAPSGQPSFTTAHPDKTFMASGGGFALRGGRNFVKTRNFPMELRGFDVGDVDGDGKPEIILADRSEVKVFRRDGTRLNLFGMIKTLVRYPVHAVNTADLNGNGRSEIYISAGDPTGPSSRCVEWDGNSFVDLFSNVPWYVRPLEVPGYGPALLGQAGGLQLAILPGIYILSNTEGTLTKLEKLPVPEEVNLFDFTYADLEGDGGHEIVAVDGSFKLRVIRKGEAVWKSSERFCGTKRFVGGEPPMQGGRSAFRNDEADSVGERFQRTYIPSRILVTDVDGDGADDIILNRNPDTVTTVAPDLVQYPSGTLVGLKWNGIGLEELWRTRQIDGYVVDYQVRSLVMPKGEGEDELYVGLMLDTESLNPFGKGQSTVVIYPFAFEKVESE
ncbi:MAG: VCBS repeat-containing protein [Desulfobulbaceae bacterium]